MKNFFIANWKMRMPHTDAVAFASNAVSLAHATNTVVLCPSFPSLDAVRQKLAPTPITLGAQDCSEHVAGAYTGQVNAATLKNVGCSYCIVGHSERRHGLDESSGMITQKMVRLFEASITPILCIGETQDDHQNGIIQETLTAQLAPVFQALTSHHQSTTLLIAYEPVWAIGTGVTPARDELATTFSWLNDHIIANTQSQFHLLYGGSVDEQNAAELLRIEHCKGFLVGGASLDFQKFQNIVSCYLEI